MRGNKSAGVDKLPEGMRARFICAAYEILIAAWRDRNPEGAKNKKEKEKTNLK